MASTRDNCTLSEMYDMTLDNYQNNQLMCLTDQLKGQPYWVLVNYSSTKSYILIMIINWFLFKIKVIKEKSIYLADHSENILNETCKGETLR